VKVLFLTPDVPEPADQGAKLRNLALIEAAAAAHHRVDVLSFASAEAVAAGPPPGLTAACHQVRLVEEPRPRGPLARSWSLLFNPLPDLGLRLESTPYRNALWDMVEAERYEIVQIEGLEMMPYLSAARGSERTAVIYDAHNAEMFLQRTIFQAEMRDPRRWLPGLYSMTQWSKLGSYERIMMNACDMVIAVSEEDALKLRGRHVEPDLVPNGVNSGAIPYREPSSELGRRLLFVGPLDYRPNANAVRWLVSGILPRVRAQSPEVELRLVGRGSERIHAPGVVGLGHLTDVGEELALADAVVVSMRMGGGVRFKLLEAMAAGVPVVSTPLGFRGLAVEHERHGLIAETTRDLADATLRVLTDRPLAIRLSQQARRLVEGRYDWSKITPGYLRLITAARRRKAQRG
jgi:glycosyltransferase involved in cell wall biosynthesis